MRMNERLIETEKTSKMCQSKVDSMPIKCSAVETDFFGNFSFKPEIETDKSKME